MELKLKNNKKILLISPQLRIAKNSISKYSKNAIRRAHPVLGILSLASHLSSLGYDVQYLDCVIEDIENTFHFDEFTDCYGLSNDDLIDRIKGYSPDLIGISCLFVSQISQILKITKRIKIEYGDCPIVVGGNYPSLKPEEIITDENIDFILRGEGELVFPDLVEEIYSSQNYSRFSCLVYKKESQIIVGKDIERIQNMSSTSKYNWDLVPLKQYWEKALPQNPYSKSRKAVPYESSRGCPEKCVFCSTAQFFGHKFRMKNSGKVIEEITDVVTKYGAEEIQFSDDNIALNYKRFLEICEGVRNLNINLCCPNGIRLDYIKDDPRVKTLFRAMKKSGFYQISFAVESGNEYILNKVINKRLDLNRMKKLVAMAQDEGIKAHAFFVVGLPYETAVQMNDTVEYAKTLNADSYSFSIATPFPGTRLWEWCLREKNFIDGFKQSDLMFGKSVIKRHDGLSIKDLENQVEQLNRDFNIKK